MEYPTDHGDARGVVLGGAVQMSSKRGTRAESRGTAAHEV